MSKYLESHFADKLRGAKVIEVSSLFSVIPLPSFFLTSSSFPIPICQLFPLPLLLSINHVDIGGVGDRNSGHHSRTAWRSSDPH